MRGWKLRTGMKQEIMMKISASINTKFKKKKMQQSKQAEETFNKSKPQNIPYL